MKKYELIEHTADVGIRVGARDLKELFKNTASAMFDIIAERKSQVRSQKSEVQEVNVRLKADSLEELFVTWLNELLSLSAIKEVVFSNFSINRLDKKSLQGKAIGEDTKNYRLNTEIKAATYHELKIERGKSGWRAEVIFDV